MKEENIEVQQGLKFGDRTPAAFEMSMKFAPSQSTAMRITDDQRR